MCSFTVTPLLTIGWFGASWTVNFRHARPGDLPVEQPTKFEMAMNANSANLLGQPIPLSILAQAEQAIE